MLGHQKNKLCDLTLNFSTFHNSLKLPNNFAQTWFTGAFRKICNGIFCYFWWYLVVRFIKLQIQTCNSTLAFPQGPSEMLHYLNIYLKCFQKSVILKKNIKQTNKQWGICTILCMKAVWSTSSLRNSVGGRLGCRTSEVWDVTVPWPFHSGQEYPWRQYYCGTWYRHWWQPADGQRSWWRGWSLLSNWTHQLTDPSPAGQWRVSFTNRPLERCSYFRHKHFYH